MDDFAEMSDADLDAAILKAEGSAASAASETPVTAEPETVVDEPAAVVKTPDPELVEPTQAVDTLDPETDKDNADVPVTPEAGAEKPAEVDNPTDTVEKPESTEPDYKAIHAKLFTPFKASGKLVTVKTPEEALALMQKGVHFNAEMQKLAPQRRIIAMLENHQLLDETALSKLISLSKKDPAAIKQLVKEAGIDPLDIDAIPEAPAPVNYSVTDQQVAWKSALENMRSLEGGNETLAALQSGWDDASLGQLYQNPEVLDTIHAQRASGVYGLITAEMDRQRAIGQMPATVPFLQGYKAVGDMLQANGGFSSLVPATAVQAQPRVPLATKPRTVPTAASDARAKAAAPTRTTPARPAVSAIKDFADVSDEQLAKLL